LRETARQIQAAGLQNEVELCVSDNGSTDNTQEVIQSVHADFASVSLRVNSFDCNKGFASNLDATVRQATGEFLFLIGDDDCFRLNGVQELLVAASRTEDFLFLKNLWNLQGRMEWDSLKANQRVSYSNVSESLVALGAFHPTFIGNFLVRRVAYLVNSESKFLNSIYPHTAIIFEVVKGKSVSFENLTCIEVDDADRRVGACSARGIAIDVARIQTEGHLLDQKNFTDVFRFYSLFLRSIPRAVLNAKTGSCPSTHGKYTDIRPRNLLEVYRASYFAMMVAVALYVVARMIPCRFLRMILT